MLAKMGPVRSNNLHKVTHICVSAGTEAGSPESQATAQPQHHPSFLPQPHDLTKHHYEGPFPFFFKEKLCRSRKLSKFLLLYTFKLKSI